MSSKASKIEKFSSDYNRLKFPSNSKEEFRGRLSSNGEKVLFWLEGRKSKDQWQTEVKDGCGPSGLPNSAVVTLVQKALGNQEQSSRCAAFKEAEETSSDAPILDMTAEYITLVIDMYGGICKLEYQYPLTPVGIDQIDVLEARVRDLQEEIEALKEDKKNLGKLLLPRPYLSLSSNVACGLNQFIDWRAPFAQRSLPENVFALSADGKEVTILQGGIYQTNVRLCGNNSSDTQQLKLMLNEAEAGVCCQADGRGFQNTAQLQEILSLKQGDVLKVQCHCNSNSLASLNGNRFTLLQIGRTE
jgi:hypothetical protein